MKITNIFPTNHFKKSYKRLPQEIKKEAVEKENIFISNPFNQRLKTHRLKGKLRNYWAYSVNYEYRIMFRFVDDESVLYFDIGTHSIYK